MLLFHLDPNLPETLQRQLREKIANAILDGQIPLDKALPSSRKLANQLNIARNTVVLAYEQLLDDGYLIAKSRSGYFVNADILQGHAQQQTRLNDIDADSMAWESLFTHHPSSLIPTKYSQTQRLVSLRLSFFIRPTRYQPVSYPALA